MSYNHIARNLLKRIMSDVPKAPKTVTKVPSELATKLAERYVGATGPLGLGRTVDVNNTRIHRYSGSFRVWDLTWAGKRGKKVRILSILPSHMVRDKGAWEEGMANSLPKWAQKGGYEGILKELRIPSPSETVSTEQDVKAIEVTPMNFQTIEINTDTALEIKSSPLSFRVIHMQEIPHPTNPTKPPTFHQVIYFNVGKPSAAIFFDWIKSNLSRVNKMSLQELVREWDRIGVAYDHQ